MQKTKILLKQYYNDLPKSKKREFLLKCIDKNNAFTLNDDYDNIDHSHKTSTNKNIINSVCKICNQYKFIKDNYTETCQICGVQRDIAPTGKNYEKMFEYIKPGANLVTIITDSKKKTVDLNKIDLWLQNTDPLVRDTQKIIDNLTIIFQGRSLDLPTSVKNTSISLWYNFNSLFTNYTGNESNKRPYNKNAILVLCIYYGALINNYTLSLEQLSLLFKIDTGTISKTNLFFKKIFENTEYYKYLTLQQIVECNIQLSPINKLLFQKVKNDLIQYDNGISDPLSPKVFASIVYYITNKVNPVIKYTLSDLNMKCNVSTSDISKISKNIEKFYKNKPQLYKQLVI